jgi:excisionase family DNA binding protein
VPELRFTEAELDWLTDALAERVAARLAARDLEQPLMTVNQAARLLGCHAKTVRRRIEAGVLSAVHEQSRVLLRADELHAYVEALGRAGSSAPARRRRRRSRDLGLDFLREQ